MPDIVGLLVDAKLQRNDAGRSPGLIAPLLAATAPDVSRTRKKATEGPG
jgi:hypothetical protein